METTYHCINIFYYCDLLRIVYGVYYACVGTGEHMGGTGHPHENLLALKPDVIAAYAMGPGGLQSFQDAGTTVLKAEGNAVNEVISAFKEGKLHELAGGCEHAHEHHHTH